MDNHQNIEDLKHIRNMMERSSKFLSLSGFSGIAAGVIALIGAVHYLGLSEIVLGILAGFFLNYGLLFWALGFGVMHIVYGIRMYHKYDRQ